MDYHQNARLTMHSREQLARRVLEQGLTLEAGRGQLQRQRARRRPSGSGAIGSMASPAFPDRSSRPQPAAPAHLERNRIERVE